MKLEIEITEVEIKSAIERKIRVAIADETNRYHADAIIKARVKELWATCLDEHITEILNDSKALKAKITAEIDRKLRNQIAALMKDKK